MASFAVLIFCGKLVGFAVAYRFDEDGAYFLMVIVRLITPAFLALALILLVLMGVPNGLDGSQDGLVIGPFDVG